MSLSDIREQVQTLTNAQLRPTERQIGCVLDNIQHMGGALMYDDARWGFFPAI